MASLFNLGGKTALVTGGTRGIGQAMAIGLAEAGADIILVQRNPQDTSTQSQIEALGRQCLIVQCDLSSSGSVSRLIPSLAMAFSPPRDISSTLPEKPENIASSLPAETRIPNNDIHILLNAAGIQYRSPSQNFPVDAFNQVLQTNLTTPFQLSRDIGHYWINQCEESSLRQRSIITIASLLSYQGGLTVPAYSASKGGVAQLVKAFSNEWAKLGIRVNGIAPGYIATDMNEGLINDKVRARQILERIPMGRWGKPEDFKGVVVWLASEKASGFVSGEVVVVDGGWMGR